ncbi:hypothetical protein LOZ48_006230, partial [Ophidiomyces ophidiicola]
MMINGARAQEQTRADGRNGLERGWPAWLIIILIDSELVHPLPSPPFFLRLLLGVVEVQRHLGVLDALGDVHPDVEQDGDGDEQHVGQHGEAQVAGAVLDDALHQRVDPAGGQVEGELEAEELGLGALGDEGGVDAAVVRAQGAAGAHEQHLLDPELGVVLVADGHARADAQAAPEDAQEVDGQEAVRPALDGRRDTRERQQEAQAAHAREDDVGERPHLVHARPVVDARDLQEERLDQAQVVGVRRVPQHPRHAQLEGLRVAADGRHQAPPVAPGQQQQVAPALGPRLALHRRQHGQADDGEDDCASGDGDGQQVVVVADLDVRAAGVHEDDADEQGGQAADVAGDEGQHADGEALDPGALLLRGGAGLGDGDGGGDVAAGQEAAEAADGAHEDGDVRGLDDHVHALHGGDAHVQHRQRRQVAVVGLREAGEGHRERAEQHDGQHQHGLA